MDKKKDSFILYNEYYEPIKMLSTTDKGLLLTALYEYQMTGNVIELPQMARVIFQFIKQRMDFNNQKYTERCQQNSENIRKRWNKDDTNEYDRIQTYTKENTRIQKNTKHTDMDIDMDMDINIPPISPLNVDKSVDNSAKKEDKEGKVYIDQDYHVAWDEHFTEELRPLSESQIGEIDYWLKNKFGFQEIPIHVIRSALITKAKRETEQKASNF